MPGMGMQEEPEDGRRVLVNPLSLRQAVDSSALKWDDRMENLAGTVGIVKTMTPTCTCSALPIASWCGGMTPNGRSERHLSTARAPHEGRTLYNKGTCSS